MIRIRVIFDLLELPIKVSNGTEIKSVTLSHIDFDLEQFLLFLLLRFHKEKNMKRRNKIVLLILMVFTFIPVSSFAAETTGVDSKNYDWNPVMEAIIQVESEGNPRAKSGNSVGVMQITPILVAECNKILKRKNSKKRYKLSDRYSISKSKEMFLLMQSVYNPLNSIEQAIRAWNGGNHYSVKRTQRYFEKVMKLLKK